MAGTDIGKILKIEREVIVLKSTLQSTKARSREASSNSFLFLQGLFTYLGSVFITKIHPWEMILGIFNLWKAHLRVNILTSISRKQL